MYSSLDVWHSCVILVPEALHVSKKAGNHNADQVFRYDSFEYDEKLG